MDGQKPLRQNTSFYSLTKKNLSIQSSAKDYVLVRNTKLVHNIKNRHHKKRQHKVKTRSKQQ